MAQLNTVDELAERNKRHDMDAAGMVQTCQHRLSQEPGKNDRPTWCVTFAYANGRTAQYNGEVWKGPRRQEARSAG